MASALKQARSPAQGQAAGAAPPGSQAFRLYVSVASPLSARAIVNTRRFLDRHLPGQYRLEVLDIALHLAQAMQDQVIASPTLVRIEPLPLRRFIGDMSDTRRLGDSLGLLAAGDES